MYLNSKIRQTEMSLSKVGDQKGRILTKQPIFFCEKREFTSDAFSVSCFMELSFWFENLFEQLKRIILRLKHLHHAMKLCRQKKVNPQG